jgi:phosphate starvation-inducible PhoH-like protein
MAKPPLKGPKQQFKGPKPQPPRLGSAPQPDLAHFTPRTDKQREAIEALETCRLVFLIGPAGTGKTIIAAYFALRELAARRARHIIMSRPPIEAGDPQGAVPGDHDDKIAVYMVPIMRAMETFASKDKLVEYRNKKTIEWLSPTLLRGNTYSDSVVIYDEMQNATPEQLRLALTRAGEGTTMIVTMDPTQCDLPKHKESAYKDVGRFLNRPGIAVIEFDAEDVVRSEIVREVLRAYADE